MWRSKLDRVTRLRYKAIYGLWLLGLVVLPHWALGGQDMCAVDRTIKDYFLSIPAQQLEIIDDLDGPLLTPSAREKAIDFVDAKQGFLTLQQDTIIARTELALVRTSVGVPVLLVTADGVSVQRQWAFICAQHHWRDITERIFPTPSLTTINQWYQARGVEIAGRVISADQLALAAHSLIRYQLPQFGPAIQVYASHPELEALSLLFDFVPVLDGLPEQ